MDATTRGQRLGNRNEGARPAAEKCAGRRIVREKVEEEQNQMKPLSVISLFLAALSLAPCVHAANTTRPNIVLMMADDQSWGETGYNGHPHVKTPVLDEMARTALRL